jgi:hypothetical protein
MLTFLTCERFASTSQTLGAHPSKISWIRPMENNRKMAWILALIADHEIIPTQYL